MSHRELPPVLVLTGANVHTFDPAAPHADEVAARDDRIAGVGDGADAPAWVVNPMLAAHNREGMNVH